jgi:hypothetical protein
MSLTSNPRVCVGVALSLALLVAAPAYAVPIGATGSMTVDGGASVEIPMAQHPESDLWGVGSWDSEIDDFTGWDWNGPEGSVSISGALDPDPMISYGIAVTDFGAPSSFGFIFSSPIVVAAGPTTVEGSISGALTNFVDGSSLSMTPTLGPTIQSSTVGPPTTGMGVDVGPAFSVGPSPNGALFVYGPHAIGPIAGPAGPWSTMTVTVGFMLSGGGDTAVLTGFSEIVEFIPEPSTYVMLAMGIAGVGLFARRRRK